MSGGCFAFHLVFHSIVYNEVRYKRPCNLLLRSLHSITTITTTTITTTTITTTTITYVTTTAAVTITTHRNVSSLIY